MMWNPWHGCHRKSEGCAHCYVFRRDAEHGIDTNAVRQTADFLLPMRRDRAHRWKVPAGTLLFTCFTSDFFLPEADEWRREAWAMMRTRSDLHFFLATKRPERIAVTLPPDWCEPRPASGLFDGPPADEDAAMHGDAPPAWGCGYGHVTVACTMENQLRTDERLPVFRDLPLAHAHIICEPLLGPIDFRGELGPWVEQVTVGGESGPEARPCDFGWVTDIRRQCVAAGVAFRFKQTGALFRKEGRTYRIERRHQMEQARRAGIDFWPPSAP